MSMTIRVSTILSLRGILADRPGVLGDLVICVFGVGAALALRLALSPWIEGAQFITFFPAVILVTLFCGTWPGLVAIGLSVLAATQVLHGGEVSLAQANAVVLFVIVATMDVSIISAMLAANAAQKASSQRIGELNASLRRSEAKFRNLIETAPDAMVIADKDDRIVIFNAQAEHMFGYARAELIGQSIAVLLPERFRQPHAGKVAAFLASPGLRRMGEGADIFGRRKDGTEFPVESNLSLLPGEDNDLVCAAIRDITARRESRELQKLLIRELNHRVKNTLASVQSIVHQTLKTAGSPEAFSEALTARLAALSQSHDVLTRSDWSGADVREIVAEQLRPYGSGSACRFSVTGPDVKLQPNRAVTLGMVLGELATNAAKYGALSNRGRVAVRWRRRSELGAPRLRLLWLERGGPCLAVPTQRGFGTRLIERSLVGLGGAARLRFGSRGVACRLDFPLLETET
ncbi:MULTISPECIES: sensor histidine kinase [unclassified Caulobacter]|uniref:sensor histidine kinase n=1 Tax=unclassified Caulobacter TaxID=2648921 RepID=UPI0009EC9045|nr:MULTISPECIES: HWE histidine kinase domain-containing protein [unclassified Caulobacter]